ncbi:MAG: TIGR00282 family metallophosphoesterase [Proteobacteria bacterium]|nr:TIGR00282 family metallophosphoesterase [Pseudomonadota bacterium]MBU1596345.1 TIGR00282 family metallophosphoesterase [Pseudomonadota bacterium]
MRILFLGDIVGRPGRHAVKKHLPAIRQAEAVDLVLANAENASGGLGLSAEGAKELFGAGVDGLSSGNHIWKFKDMPSYMAREERLVRPANYPPGTPGRGWTILRVGGLPPVALLNLMGRTYMQALDCPFRAADALLAQLDAEHPDARVRILDFHAEATSEKSSLGWHLDGRVTAVLGTHTHVQTNDARLLRNGTAFITDLGMCGPLDSCLGMDIQPILRKFLTAAPERFEVASGPVGLRGAVLDIDVSTGRARDIQAWRFNA